MHLIDLSDGRSAGARAELSAQGKHAQASHEYTQGRQDGYEVGYANGQQDASFSSAAWAFAAGAILMAAILLPALWPAA
jgi:hypothetical protein